MINRLRIFCVHLVIIFLSFSLLGYEPFQDIEGSESPVLVILIDGAAYQEKQAEELAVYWNNKMQQSLLSFNEKYEAVIKEQVEYFLSAGFGERLSILLDELYFDFLDIRTLAAIDLEALRITDAMPFEIAGVYRFDDLFHGLEVVSIEGYLYPVSVISIVMESMNQTSRGQWAALYANLERELTRMYDIRMENSLDFANWVHGWGNFFTRSYRELFGTWADEYASQYETRINRGLDTELPEKIISQAKDKADILLITYANILAYSSLPTYDEIVSGVSINQIMDYEQIFEAYSLIEKLYYAGQILGIDVSGWHMETNNRLSGGMDIGFRALSIVLIIASKFHPIGIIAEVAFETGRTVWFFATRQGKIKQMEAELRESLANELALLLEVLQSVH